MKYVLLAFSGLIVLLMCFWSLGSIIDSIREVQSMDTSLFSEYLLGTICSAPIWIISGVGAVAWFRVAFSMIRNQIGK